VLHGGQESQVAFNDRQFDQPKIVQCQLLVARPNRATLLEPPDHLLDYTAVAIPKRIVAERPTWPPPSTHPLGRDDRTKPLLPQPVPQPQHTVGPIGADTPWSSAWSPTRLRNADRVEQLLELSRLVRLARQQQHGKHQATAITGQMDLGAKTTT
jgi:hypothetical protein